MALFGKKKRGEEMPAAAGPEAGIPTDRVIQLRQQGLSNNQIIQSLQREGYSTTQIFDAMNQADIKRTVEAVPGGEPASVPTAEMPPPPAPEAVPPEAVPPPPTEAMPPMPEMPPPSAGGISREEAEEIIEGIVDEKWNELMKSLDKVLEWKDVTESKITKMEEKIKSLEEDFDKLHQGVISKVGEYDKNIRAVGSDIKAMETVFKKVLPTFTENVAELSRVTKKIKSKKK